MTKTKRRRRLQISLRMMLIVVTLVGFGFAYDQRFRQQHIAADLLAANGAKITYHPSPLRYVPWVRDKIRHVESVDLSHCRVDQDQLKWLLKCPHLRRLYLARAYIRTEHLPLIAKHTELERLALWGNPFKDRGVHHLEALQNLQALDVHDTSLTEASLRSFSKLKQLREFKFNFRKISDIGLGYLAEMNSFPLGDLNCERITDAGLRSLRKIDRDNYQIVRIQDSNISDEALLSLADESGKLPVGPGFQIRQCPITDSVLNALPWDSLTDVRFVGTSVTFAAVVNVIGEKIGVLQVGETGLAIIEDWDWEAVHSSGWAPIGVSVWVENDPTEFTPQQLEKLPNLNAVYWGRKKPANNLLVDLSACSQLTRFKLESFPAETPVVEQISQWKHLQHVHINCCNPRTNIDVQPLTKLKELQTLRFNCTPFGDEALESLGQIEQLRELRMTSAHGVKGPGLKHLRNLKHLERLEIQSRSNWDPWFEELMKFDVPRFKLVDVGLSKSNIETFETETEWVYIRWR